MWSLLELLPTEIRINVLDVGAALAERPPYQSLVDAGRRASWASNPMRKSASG